MRDRSELRFAEFHSTVVQSGEGGLEKKPERDGEARRVGESAKRETTPGLTD
jgi:hypothetical protein